MENLDREHHSNKEKSLNKSGRNYAQKGKAYLNENPNKSIAISAMAGAAVGSIITLLARRRK